MRLIIINLLEIEIPMEKSNFSVYTPKLSVSKSLNDPNIYPKFTSKLSLESGEDDLDHQQYLTKSISHQMKNYENSSLSDRQQLSIPGHTEFTFNDGSKVSGQDSILQVEFEQIDEEDEKDNDIQSTYTFGGKELKANE